MHRLFVSCLAIGVTSLAAFAQDNPRPRRQDGDRPAQPGGGQPGERGGGGRNLQLPPEKAKAAWDLTATGVCKRLGFTDDHTKAVVKAYADARTSQAAAAQKLRDKAREEREAGGDEGGDPRARMQEGLKAIEEMTKTEREKLTKALEAAIGAENATKAVASLGLFAPNWDRMVDAIGEFKLEAAKQQNALNAVETFIVNQAKLLRDADMDREERQATMREGREKLLAALKPILSEEQLAKFEQSTGGGRGRGGEGGGGGGGGNRPNRGGGGGGGGF